MRGLAVGITTSSAPRACQQQLQQRAAMAAILGPAADPAIDRRPGHASRRSAGCRGRPPSSPSPRDMWRVFRRPWRAYFQEPLVPQCGSISSSRVPLRNILEQSHSSFDPNTISGRKILIANLARGKIGPDKASFVGSMLISASSSPPAWRRIPEAEGPGLYL